MASTPRARRAGTEWAHPTRTCAGTGLATAHTCAGTGLTPAYVSLQLCAATGRTPPTCTATGPRYGAMATLLDGQYEVFWNVAGASLELALRVRTTGCAGRAGLCWRPEAPRRAGWLADRPREYAVEYSK